MRESIFVAEKALQKLQESFDNFKPHLNPSFYSQSI